MQNQINVSWEQIHTLTEALAEDISTEYTIDNIVAIARGGVVPARYFAKLLGIRRMYTLGVEFYIDEEQKLKIPTIYQGLTEPFNCDGTTLIVDDIVDSGGSMIVAVNEVSNKGACDIITCSLHYKPKSTYTPTFYGEKVPNDVWLKYDWEK